MTKNPWLEYTYTHNIIYKGIILETQKPPRPRRNLKNIIIFNN